MPKLELVTAEVCPFAQRSHMTLLEKNLEFELMEVDLENKPSWFETVSPYSKVPVLCHGNIQVYESTIINEYLEESFPERRLLPDDPSKRANARIWIDFDNTKFVPVFYKLLLEQESSLQKILVAQMTERLVFLDQEGFSSASKGPYWFGQKLSLVDLSLYPHFERFPVLTEYRGMNIPRSCQRLRAWLDVMRERPSAVVTAHEPGFHIEAYIQYANGTASGTTAKDMRT
jgi:glutathione S-transferase